MVAEENKKIVAFSSGYIPPLRPDTFFSWEVIVAKDYRGNGLQKTMLLNQISQKNVRFLEATVNPSNEVSIKNYREIAQLLNAQCRETLLFAEEDFENDGHEAEVLFRIGSFFPFFSKKFSAENLKNLYFRYT